MIITADKINKYIGLLRTEDDIHTPSGGDCWYCMFEWNGKKVDDLHLISHIEEGYMPGYLLANAMREYGYSDEQIGLHFKAFRSPDIFKLALRRYLKKRVLGKQYEPELQERKLKKVKKSNPRKKVTKR